MIMINGGDKSGKDVDVIAKTIENLKAFPVKLRIFLYKHIVALYLLWTLSKISLHGTLKAKPQVAPSWLDARHGTTIEIT